MRKLRSICVSLATAAVATGLVSLGTTAIAADALPDEKQCRELQPTEATLKGWCVAIIRRKGNCLACHTVTTKKPWPETLPPGGNIAPPLVSMKQRFPDKDKLWAQVHDATQANPQSVMPPFGKHNILSSQEIDALVEWLYSI